jgi:hypothetical protein
MIFHIIACLYGLYLQTINNIIINILGLVIIYHHSIDSTFNRPQSHKNIIRFGAVIGSLIGISENNILIYGPFLFSFLSKFPYYVTTVEGQIRTITITFILLYIIYTTLNSSNCTKKSFHKKKINNRI